MNSEDSCLMVLPYLPSISYFHSIKLQQRLLLNAFEDYQKQSTRNRTTILTANGILNLTIPVKHGVKKYTEAEIDYGQPWLKNHLKGIYSSYRHAAYFEFYFPYFEDIFTKRIPLLFNFNKELLEMCLKMLKLHVTPQLVTNSENVNLKNYIGREFSDKSQLSQERISIPYRQVFGKTFTPDLSIIDLVFNMGPDSLLHL